MATSSSPAFGGHRHGQHNNQSTRREPQPLPSCSQASQVPSPNGDGETGLLPGDKVEVRLDGKGYYGIWYEATVVEFAAASSRHARARYSITFDGDDKRWFASTHVRPRPPAMESLLRFRPYDIVEAFHERGWWSGLVLSADPRSVTVAFPITREVITYLPRLVRPRRDYVDGDWVPSRAVVVVAVGPKCEFRRFEVGDVVEVVRERKVWIPAKVAKVVDEFTYIVEYSDQNGEEVGGSEYLHWQFIRPAAPLENEFHRRTSAKRQAKQEQLASGKRAKSLVEVPFNGDEHIRDAEYSCPKGSIRAQQKLPILVQDPENASFSGHSTHRKIVESDNMQNQLGRKKAITRKVYATKKRLNQKEEAFEGPQSVLGPLELSRTGQMIGVNVIAGSQREPSLALERSESAQQQLGCTFEDTVNANEVKYHEPLAVVPLSFASTSDGIGIHGPKFNEGLTAQDSRVTDVLTKNSRTQAPFVSSLLPAVEEMDVLKEFPQQPHFLPLQQYPETIQKGMKLGLKVAFNDCVRRIRKSSIEDDEGSFEEKKRTLAELKKNGFTVEYFEGLLDRLIKVKDENSKHLEEKSAVQTQKQQAESSSERRQLLIDEIDKKIGVLETKLGRLRLRGQLIEEEKEHDDEIVSRLKMVERDMEDALDDDVQKFSGILAEGQQKCLT